MGQLKRHGAALAPGLIAVALMLVWAVHDGGYDADTWYWGALVLLATSAVVVIASGSRLRLSRPAVIALAAFAAYVAWSYLSIAWAQSPGDALQGSNRALLYLLLFGLMIVLPWTPEAAFMALLTLVLGVGVIAIVLLVRLASADHVASLVIDGRLAAPTGYFNSTAALFTIDSLAAAALASRRELPGLLRGILIALACAGLQLAVIVQSRGWLFTLPLVALIGIVIVPDRLRVLIASLIPIAAALAPLPRLLDVYQSAPGTGLDQAAAHAGRASLTICAAMVVAGTLIAWGESLLRLPPMRRGRRRAAVAAVTALVAGGFCAGGIAATHGHPFGFISRQWRGFSHVQASSSGSHFTDVGSGRYDFWRVSLDALAAHPVGGLGQDNFEDYYVPRRRTGEEPSWTHSLVLRLLAHTGSVGFGLFALFLIAAITAALRTRRGGGVRSRAVAGAALLPLIVWLIHGSVDWFWEMPALSSPALGFLAMAAALGRPRTKERRARRHLRGAVPIVAGAAAVVAAAIVLGFPYLSVREVSLASEIRTRNPSAALRDLTRAAELNPLSADPGRLGGAIALQTGQFAEAERRFSQATTREPGGWFAWLGEGLAASARGDRAHAHHDFVVAASIDSRQTAVRQALTRLYTRHPLTPMEAFQMLVVAK